MFSLHKKSVSTIVFEYGFLFLVRNKNQVNLKPSQPLHYSYGKTIFIIYSHIYKLCLTSTVATLYAGLSGVVGKKVM